MRERADGDDLPEVPPLDRLFEHRTRLAIAVLLAPRDALSFRRLRDALDETDGSLGAHLRRLEEAGYVSVDKEFVDRKPVSWYRLTPAGREALRRHVRGLESLLGALPLDTAKDSTKKRRQR